MFDVHSPSGYAVHNELTWLATHRDLVLDFALVGAQVAALDGEQSAALEWAGRGMDLVVGVGGASYASDRTRAIVRVRWCVRTCRRVRLV